MSEYIYNGIHFTLGSEAKTTLKFTKVIVLVVVDLLHGLDNRSSVCCAIRTKWLLDGIAWVEK